MQRAAMRGGRGFNDTKPRVRGMRCVIDLGRLLPCLPEPALRIASGLARLGFHKDIPAIPAQEIELALVCYLEALEQKGGLAPGTIKLANVHARREITDVDLPSHCAPLRGIPTQRV